MRRRSGSAIWCCDREISAFAGGVAVRRRIAVVRTSTTSTWLGQTRTMRPPTDRCHTDRPTALLGASFPFPPGQFACRVCEPFPSVHGGAPHRPSLIIFHSYKSVSLKPAAELKEVLLYLVIWGWRKLATYLNGEKDSRSVAIMLIFLHFSVSEILYCHRKMTQ